tara:strand:+ start:263 stop:742 length:480 start_codon:yes stop_codon:yes gene_type:complete
MAGIGKYKKGAAFTLKSGNKPSFTQMGSGLSPGKYKTTPLLAEDETPKVKEGDSKAVKLGKVLGNMAIGGSNAALGTKIHEFKINRGENEEKIDKEAEVKTIGQKMDELIGTVGVKGSNIRGTLTKDYEPSDIKVKGSLIGVKESLGKKLGNKVKNYDK